MYFKESHGITIKIMSKNLVIPWYFFKGSTSQIFDSLQVMKWTSTASLFALFSNLFMRGLNSHLFLKTLPGTSLMCLLSVPLSSQTQTISSVYVYVKPVITVITCWTAFHFYFLLLPEQLVVHGLYCTIAVFPACHVRLENFTIETSSTYSNDCLTFHSIPSHCSRMALFGADERPPSDY